MTSPGNNIIDIEVSPEGNQKRPNRFLRFLKSCFLFVLLIAVIGSSFWVSYLLGKRILVPVKNLPDRKIEVIIPEPPPSIAALEKAEIKIAAVSSKVLLVEEKVKNTSAKKTEAAKKEKYASVDQKTYYKVQAGVCSDKTNAMDLAEKLNLSGFHTYLRRVSSGWRVQVGAFSKKVEALGLQNMLQSKGFSSTLLYE